MYLEKNEITIVCNQNLFKAKQTLGLALTINRKINIQDIASTRISVNLFCLLLFKSGISPKQLVNRAHPYYQSELKNRDFTNEDWFYILKHKPELLVNPLVVYKDKSSLCQSPSDILKVA